MVVILIIAIIFTVIKLKKTNELKANWEILSLDGELIHQQLLSDLNNIVTQNTVEETKESSIS